MKYRQFSLVIALLSFGVLIHAFSIDDDWLTCTAVIRVPDGRGGIASGTGFFVVRQIQTNLSKLFLVSNKHVLNSNPILPDATNHLAVANVLVTFADDKGSSITNLVVILRDAAGNSRWVGHPANNVDVGVLDVTDTFVQDGTLKTGFKVGFVNENRFSTTESISNTSLTIGDRVVILGYPLSIVEGSTSLPIARGGTISTPPDRNYQTVPQFLVDCSQLRGASGSPVFVPVRPYSVVRSGDGKVQIKSFKGELPELLGIMSATVKDWEIVVRQTPGLGSSVSELTLIDTANLGIAFRAEAISETLDRTGIKRYRGNP